MQGNKENTMKKEATRDTWEQSKELKKAPVGLNGNWGQSKGNFRHEWVRHRYFGCGLDLREMSA